MSFELLQKLSESKLVPYREGTMKYSAKEIAELSYLFIISLRILLCENDSKTWAQTYCRKSTRGYNFYEWRSDGTDLYVLLHSLIDDTEKLKSSDQENKYYRTAISIYPQIIYRWVRDAGINDLTEEENKILFLKLDDIFHISDSSMKSIRRLVQDWPTIDNENKKLAITKLILLLKTKAYMSEIFPELDRLARNKKYIIDKKKNENFIQSLENKIQNESASSGASCAAGIAAVPGALGAGFDNDYSKSIYPPPKKKKKPVILKRTKII